MGAAFSGDAGKDHRELSRYPAELRAHPRFVKQVEAFITNYPEGYYTKAETRLLAAKGVPDP